MVVFVSEAKTVEEFGFEKPETIQPVRISKNKKPPNSCEDGGRIISVVIKRLSS